MECINIVSSPGCVTQSDGTKISIDVVTECRLNAADEVVPYKIRYVLADGSLYVLQVGDSVSYGTCGV